jgi:hypothetical protein
MRRPSSYAIWTTTLCFILMALTILVVTACTGGETRTTVHSNTGIEGGCLCHGSAHSHAERQQSYANGCSYRRFSGKRSYCYLPLPATKPHRRIVLRMSTR